MTTTLFQQPAAGTHNPPLTGIAGILATQVIDTIKNAAANAPRTLQTTVGPSELGTPCDRRLGYRILDWDPKPNTDTDPWASIIGTAVHAWMATTYHNLNTQLGRERWLVERRVPLPGMPHGGSTDLYDRDWELNNDWKITSLDNLAKYRRNGPGPQYQTQAHLYCLGLQMTAETPKWAAITFLPRGGRIDQLHVWAEPYNPALAIAAIKRYETIRTFHWTVDPEANPQHWALLRTADAHCTYCPWHLPGSTDLSKGCPGHNPT